MDNADWEKPLMTKLVWSIIGVFASAALISFSAFYISSGHVQFFNAFFVGLGITLGGTQIPKLRRLFRHWKARLK